jgi:hypothetical protein
MAQKKNRLEFALTLTVEFVPAEDQEFNLAKATKAFAGNLQDEVISALGNNGVIADYTSRGQTVEVDTVISKAKLKPVVQAE